MQSLVIVYTINTTSMVMVEKCISIRPHKRIENKIRMILIFHKYRFISRKMSTLRCMSLNCRVKLHKEEF